MNHLKKLPVCRLADIPVGRVKHFRYGIHPGIVYNDAGVLKAYVNTCTHMGGATDLQSSGRLRCCRHFAEFDPKTGERLSGQAPEGTRLPVIPLEQEGDQIFALLEMKADEFSF